MEQLLIKIAKQLDSIDEASLMTLWEKYASIVSRFEPTKRWEEATIVFSLIQAKHMKNQLFNYNWSAQIRPSSKPPLTTTKLTLENEQPANKYRAKILSFSSQSKTTEKDKK